MSFHLTAIMMINKQWYRSLRWAIYFFMCRGLVHRQAFFVAMVTYYCKSLEGALCRAKEAAKRSGCYFGGITLKSGKRGFGVYRDGRRIQLFVKSGL